MFWKIWLLACETAYVIDLGTDDPEVAEMLLRGLAIVDEVVSSLHDEFLQVDVLPAECELARLSAALPQGPLDLASAIAVALGSARGALSHVSYVIQNPVPTSPVVLQSLLRTALVGSARTLYILLPQDPNTRVERGRAILARDGESGRQGLIRYAAFKGMRAIAPPLDLVQAVGRQRDAMWPRGNPPGDGKIVEGMTQSLVEAFEIEGLADEFGPDFLHDHTEWLWNTYSGIAHGYLWPRLLWGVSPDRRIPGDFPLDLHQIAASAHMAIVAALSRSLPGTAGTTEPVPNEWQTRHH